LAASLGAAAAAQATAAGRGLSLDDAVVEAAALLVWLPSKAPSASLGGSIADVALVPDGLTAREAEVLRLLAGGLRDREIAERLSISHGTARKHVYNVLAKLGLHTRAAAAAYAHQHGLT
jgi:DNA-binding NarL/FixJ family response regulator